MLLLHLFSTSQLKFRLRPILDIYCDGGKLFRANVYDVYWISIAMLWIRGGVKFLCYFCCVRFDVIIGIFQLVGFSSSIRYRWLWGYHDFIIISYLFILICVVFSYVISYVFLIYLLSSGYSAWSLLIFLRCFITCSVYFVIFECLCIVVVEHTWFK